MAAEPRPGESTADHDATATEGAEPARRAPTLATASDRDRPHRPERFHPLCGANPGTLLSLVATSGLVSPRYLPHALIALAASFVRLPFSTAERALFAWARRGRASMPAPIFIIGYWRSGTTHVHNVLSRDPQFGHISPLATGLPWDLLGLVRVLAPLLVKALPANRFIDDVAVAPDSPQEDSIALANMVQPSYYHGIYFPRRFHNHFARGVFFDHCAPREIAVWRRTLVHFLEKVSMHQGGRRLLVKNPVYTAHIPLLREIWPGAKFIHVYRNPFDVFPSTRHFYATLLDKLALQRYHGVPVDDVILHSYQRMMETLLADSASLAAGAFVEIRFEDFERNPLPELERIYGALDLDGFARARSRFQAYLRGISGYRKNVYDFDLDSARLVSRHWGRFLRQWRYRPPHSSTGAGSSGNPGRR